MKKLIIIVTVPVVLETWLKGQANFLSKFYEVEIITSNSNSIKNIEKFENVSIKVMDFNRKINFFKDLKVLSQLFIHFIKNRPSFVYTLTPKAGLLGMISSWMAKVPYRVHNVVGLPHVEAKGNKKSILKFTERLTYLFSTNLYCNSINLIDEMKKLTNKKVNVIGNGSVNGVDIEYFNDNYSASQKTDIRVKNNIKSNDFVITFVGRVVEDKGINELINVFTRLQTEQKNIKLLIIGDYEEDLHPISRITKEIIEFNKNILYYEFQDDIRSLLSISDLFVLPSYREGLPNVLIEAGSYGIPLIATDINGCNEIIINGENGILIKKKNEIELFDAIEKMMTDNKYYLYIKSNVRKSIKNRYSQEYFYSELINEFTKIETVKI